MTLADLQNEVDYRGIAIEEVGISGVRYPISIHGIMHDKQETVATVSLSATLPAERKGSHLSRFVEVLESTGGEFAPDNILRVLQVLRERLDSPTARVRLEFPYFLRRHAPVSQASALVDYDCAILAKITPERFCLQLVARVPVTSVCPCSKAISDYGAHNQRGYLTIEATPFIEDDPPVLTLWFEELIEAAEASGSSPVFPLLKREDERHVTMAGYDRPVFVEDMVRNVTTLLRQNPRIEAFSVKAINEESIHNHEAFASLSWPPRVERDCRW